MRQLFYHSTKVPGLNMDLFGGILDWRLLAGADSLRGGEEAPQAEPLHLSRTSKYRYQVFKFRWVVTCWRATKPELQIRRIYYQDPSPNL